MSTIEPLAPEPSRPRRGVVQPVRTDPTGRFGPTEGQARGPGWRRTSRGFYVAASVDGARPEQRIVEAAAVLPELGGVTGWAGLRWEGAVWFDGTASTGLLPVDVATGYCDVRNQRGLVVSQERLHPGEVHEVDGIRTTHAVRSLCFAMRYAADVREATVAADMAAFSDLVSLDESALYHQAHPGWIGIPQARAALAFADENSWSPWETRMRMIWVLDADLPPPLCNQPVFDRSGHHLATPDIFDPESGVAGEYNGAHHLESRQYAHDVVRVDRLRQHGLEDFIVTAPDMADPDVVVRRMLAARSRARWEPESRRSWTIERPPWWSPSHTVGQRRALPAWHPALRIRRTT